MRRTIVVVVGLLTAFTVGLVGSAWGAASSLYTGATIIGRSGSIQGVVLCGEGETAEAPVPREWSTVWVQGAGFSARTDENGAFRIDYVPPGTYTLGVQTSGMPIRGEFSVTVLPRTSVDVGQLVVHGGCGACGGGEEGGGEEGGGEEGGGCCSGG